MAVYTDDSFMRSLQQHVRREMDIIVEEEAQKAAERVQERTRAIAPKLAMELLTYFDLMRDGRDVIIKVRQPDAARTIPQ